MPLTVELFRVAVTVPLSALVSVNVSVHPANCDVLSSVPCTSEDTTQLPAIDAVTVSVVVGAVGLLEYPLHAASRVATASTARLVILSSVYILVSCLGSVVQVCLPDDVTVAVIARPLNVFSADGFRQRGNDPFLAANNLSAGGACLRKPDRLARIARQTAEVTASIIRVRPAANILRSLPLPERRDL